MAEKASEGNKPGSAVMLQAFTWHRQYITMPRQQLSHNSTVRLPKFKSGSVSGDCKHILRLCHLLKSGFAIWTGHLVCPIDVNSTMALSLMILQIQVPYGVQDSSHQRIIH